ncbi:RIP metalloprotease RseP [Novosphingobium sp. TH158]|uniref:RIP metalloprotease RseP n=1 Tax=Novosphingobium sp. TH158 TaxID=2067455 RepID=UPI0020B16B95|nr:RIP metalloprotease RseP [Novosphingobium sp. TH158]
MFQFPPLIQSIIGFLLLIGPLVVLHELGHYLVARWLGVKSDVFSIGFGKELWGWTDKRGTRWRLAAIPLGGYVQFAGDGNAVSQTDEDKIGAMSAEERSHAFATQPLWKRALIVAAGPVANILVAVVIFAAFFMAFGKIAAPPVIGEFGENAAAQAAGLKLGDRIVAIDGAKIEEFPDIAERVAPYPGQEVTLVIRRDGQEFERKVRLQDFVKRDKFGNETHIGLLGIRPTTIEVIEVGPVKAVALAFEESWGIVRTLTVGLKQIITGERSLDELGGPVKTAKFSGEQLSLGWLSFVSFIGFISINLAFINLLPIPTLDGGHLAFYAAEAVRRRPVDAKGQEWAFRTGLAFVLALMLFVTINDIASLLPIGK